MKRKKDEYEVIYDYEESDIEDDIENLRGTIGRGDCVYCGAKDSMEYIGDICFICSKCNKSVHEDIYYAWAAGCDVEMED